MNNLKYLYRFIIGLILCMVGGVRSVATHIVGGEFELIYIDGFTYQLNLVQYFDNVNGNPEAEDPEILVRIFRKSDNESMRLITLENKGYTFVPYTNIECTIEELETRRIFYSTTITLSPDVYNDPQGYYVIWERCCRNNIISNIINPEATGQTFYLEFPAVVKNDEPFINSSPILFPPLSDYACINEFYFVDFTGMDPDGDSLVYSLAHPLAGYSSQTDPAPIPRPAPYPLVVWSDGINTSNSVPGSPPLSISKDGLLTVVPEESGLFVFSVLCEEYRDSEKIGEVRRDFQMFVIDCPDPGSPPEIKIKSPGTTQYAKDLDTLYFAFNDKKCLDFMVMDRDGDEPISIRVKPVNFSAPTDTLLSVSQGLIESPTDTLLVEICFPECPYTRDKPYIIDLIAGDDACPLPLMDTARLIVYQEPPPNTPSYFTNSQNFYTYNIREGEIVELEITGIDPDMDSMEVLIIAEDFTLKEFDMQVETIEDKPGEKKLRFYWDSDCKKYDFNKITTFGIQFKLEDFDYCEFEDPDFLFLQINVELPPNTSPYVSTSLPTDSVSMKILDQLTFQVMGKDDDGDKIKLVSQGILFDPVNAGFSTIDTTGISEVSSDFTWKLNCNTINPNLQNSFSIFFIVEDYDKCKIQNADTIIIDFTALLPDNKSPQLVSPNYPQNQAELKVGEDLLIELLGYDPDYDSLSLTIMKGRDHLEEFDFKFNPAKGRGSVKSTLTWNTICEYLDDDFQNRELTFSFLVEDDRCLVATSDTLVFNIILKDLPVDIDSFLPPNVITPNRDDINEVFTLPDLPEDNCYSQFEYVSIVNRYGKEVFFSSNRDFKWNAKNVNAGVYYYLLKFSKWEFKEVLSVVY